MNEKIDDTRYISIRVTQGEFVDINKQCAVSGHKSLTEYIRNMLKQQRGADKLSDHYQVELLTTLNGFILRLDFITDLLIRMKLARPPAIAEMETWAKTIISTIDPSPDG